MEQGREHRRLRPSPAMIVALIALLFAMSGTAVAATKLVNGDRIIKKHTLSGDRLRSHTVTGRQINLALLGKVPFAAQADSATNASHATVADSAAQADNATNAGHAAIADSIGGIGPLAFGTSYRVAGIDFKPLDSTTNYHNPGYGEMYTTTPGTQGFGCTIHLPQGAKVTQVTMYYDKTTLAGDCGELDLFRIYPAAYPDGGTELLAIKNYPNNSLGEGSASATLPTPEVIDNTKNTYELAWDAPGNQNRLVGAKIDYTMP